jgi:hypothetical protein
VLSFKGGKPTGQYQDFIAGFTAGQQNVWRRASTSLLRKTARCC